MQTFYGVEVTPGKTSAFVPPPIDAQLHLSQATLSLDARSGERVGVTAKVDEDGPDVLICSLREGASESQSLDLIFDSYAEFKVVGSASVHLSGYYMPEHGYDDQDDEEDDEESDEDEELDDISPEDLRALAAYGRGMPRHVAIDSEEEGDTDEDDEEYDDDEDEDDEDEDDELARKDSGIIITELNHDGSEKFGIDEDDDDDEDEDDDEEPAAEAIQIDEDIAKKGGVQIDEGLPSSGVQVDAEGVNKRKGPGVEAQKSKRAKKAADVAVAAAKDAIAQAAGEEEPEGDEEDMIDVAAATDAPSMEEEAAQAAAVAEEPEEAAAAAKKPLSKKAEEPEEAAAAAEKPLSKKAKKRAAKEAAANAAAAPTEPASKSVPIKHTRPKVQKFDNGFIIEDTAMGPAEGKEAKPGNKVGVRYKGWLAKTNKIFDQTKGSKTFNFRVGVGEVIKGWDRGVVGMRPGDKRRLTVPPQMAYGTAGVKGAIPGNATLVFEVELVDIKGK